MSTHLAAILRTMLKPAGPCALAFSGMVVMTPGEARAQGVPVPYAEAFDTALPPGLPAGWRSSTNRSPGSADFVTVASSPNSPPHAVMATNATVGQWLETPPLDCRAGTVGRLMFAVRRSSTFGARCVVEASTDGGGTYGVQVGEVTARGVSGSYAVTDLPLPGALAGQAAVAIRWRILPDTAGTTGTFRMDDVRVSVARPPVAPGTVVLNEIQSQPVAGEPEWIEILNTGTEAVDLSGWTVSDASVTATHRLAALPRLLPADGCAVVVGDSAAFRSHWSRDSLFVLQSDGFPSLNNAGDLVLLRDAEGRCMDSVWYQQWWGGGNGISLERIDPLSPLHGAAHWGSCRVAAGATPGRANSIVIRDRDLSAAGISLASGAMQETAFLNAIVRNTGRQPSGPFTVRVADDADRDSTAADAEVVTSAYVHTPIAPHDSLCVDLCWNRPSPGRHQVIMEILWPEDQRPETNTSVSMLQLAIPRGGLSINEIQASPAGGTAEYVEVVNAGGSPVELAGCWIADRPLPSGSVNRWPVATAPRLLRPGELHVIAGDSTVSDRAGVPPGACTVVSRAGLGLNNDGDCVVLCGPDSCILDSVAYDPSWHSASIADPAGRSLEKYSPQLSGTDPGSWGTCVDPSGGTPGRQNSILVSVLPARAALSCAPDPFSPDGDGVDDVTVVRYQLPLRSGLVRLRIYDIRGRCVRDLLNTDPAGAAGEAVWDGYDNNRRPLRIGIYILFLEAIDAWGGNVIVAAKKAVVLARRL